MLQSCVYNSGSISLELSNRNSVVEKFINLFESAAFCLGHAEKEEKEACKVRPRPDVSVLGALDTQLVSSWGSKDR